MQNPMSLQFACFAIRFYKIRKTTFVKGTFQLLGNEILRRKSA